MISAVHSLLLLVCDGFHVWRVDCSDEDKRKAINNELAATDLDKHDWHRLSAACGCCRACKQLEKYGKYRRAVGDGVTAFDRPDGLGSAIKSAF